MLRITVDRKHARIALDCSISPKQFIADPQKEYQHIRHSNPKPKSVKKYSDEKNQEAKDAAIALHKEGKSIPAQSIKRYHSFPYQAGRWSSPQKIVVKVEVSTAGTNVRYNLTNLVHFGARAL